MRDHLSFIWYLINSTIVGHSTIKSECVARHSVVWSFYFFHLIDYMQHMIVLLWIQFKCYLFISEYIKTLLFIDGFHLEVRTRGQCTLYNIEYYIHIFFLLWIFAFSHSLYSPYSQPNPIWFWSNCKFIHFSLNSNSSGSLQKFLTSIVYFSSYIYIYIHFIWIVRASVFHFLHLSVNFCCSFLILLLFIVHSNSLYALH